MQVHGVLFALLDMPSELTEEYNRWYDLDHMPEHVSKSDVALGRRYVAPRDLRDLRDLRDVGSTSDDLFGAHAPYLTMYYLVVPNFADDDVTGAWLTKDRGLLKSGRFFREGSVRFSRSFRLGATRARSSVLVSDDAIPYLAHRGVVVALGRAPSPEHRADAIRWWDATHLVDLLAVEGVLAALRLDPVADDDQDLLLHVLLLEVDPAVAMSRIDRALRYAKSVGRYPAHGGVYESSALLPYRTIAPLEYDFDFGA